MSKKTVKVEHRTPGEAMANLAMKVAELQERVRELEQERDALRRALDSQTLVIPSADAADARLRGLRDEIEKMQRCEPYIFQTWDNYDDPGMSVDESGNWIRRDKVLAIFDDDATQPGRADDAVEQERGT